jgi:osmotically-inducible protein OsmY
MNQKELIYKGLIIISAMLLTMCDFQQQREQTSTWEINDTTIVEAIHKEFVAHPEISVGSMEIDVKDGIVTVGGTADNLLEKEMATELVMLIRGVKGVVNLMEVKEMDIVDDALARNIKFALDRDPVLESYKIIVETDNGKVSLHGEVFSWHEKQLAVDVVKQVKGVTAVKNNLSFIYTEERPLPEIEQNIISLLHNDVRIDDGMIEVEVSPGTVTLNGEVGSAAEKSLAISLAHVNGVDTVVADDLDVSPEHRDRFMRKEKYADKSDSEIVEAVLLAFMQDPRLRGHDILVSSADGNVTLSGTVTNLRAKKAAGTDASNIVGVWNVDNNIQVEPGNGEPVQDITTSANQLIQGNEMLNDYGIKAISSGEGAIQLLGSVDYNFEKKNAEELVANLPGVREIDNNIEVEKGIILPFPLKPGRDAPELPSIKKPDIKSDKELREDIIYQFYWSPYVDRNQVVVEVEDGNATLKGTVNTRLEMEHAVKNAYEGGAFSVDNQLRVNFWQI